MYDLNTAQNMNMRTLSRLVRLAPVLFASLLLGGCLGDSSTPLQYSRQIVFGDSLSDVGSYAVGAIAAAHGGKFTVNSIPASPQNWSEQVAGSLNLPPQCAAQTGLSGDPAQGFYAPVTYHDGCYNYAQGGARVTNPAGPHNSAIEPALGFLTVPVVSQIQNHLARAGGAFAPGDLVFVLAGGNDFLWQSDALSAAVVAGLSQQVSLDIQSGICVPTNQSGSNCMPAAIDHAITRLAPDYVAAMALAGKQLAALVTNQILAHGAQRVVVLNLPDAGLSPSMQGRSTATKAVVSAMVQAFNDNLAAGLQDQNGRILQLDVYARFNTWAANPATYGFSNFTNTACDLTHPVPNLLGSSITCSTANTVPGDVSRYAFADSVHPTPYTNSLIAGMVLDAMSQRGWR